MRNFETFRRHWRRPEFWQWLWYNRVPFGAKMAGGLALLLLTLALGWVAAEQLSPASASVERLYSVTTEHRVVTVIQRGKIVRTRVPVIKRVVVPGAPGKTKTQTQTQTAIQTLIQTVARPVTSAGGVETVFRPVTTTVQEIKWRSVTLVQTVVDTVTETQTVPVTVTVTLPGPTP